MVKVKFNVYAWESRYWNFDTEIEVPDDSSEEEIQDIISDAAYGLTSEHRPTHEEFEEVDAKVIEIQR